MSSSPLDSLPEPPDRRLAVRVTPDALRQVRGGHPWLYADKITGVTGVASPGAGTLGVVFDDKRKFVGIGLWDPDSPIRLRVLHTGSPRPIDETFWRERVAAAAAIRADLPAVGTTGYRLINGENDGFGGLIVDRFAETLVAKIYTAAWFPHFRNVVSALEQVAGPERVVVRLGRSVARLAASERHGLVDGCVVSGQPIDGPVLFTENGLTFEADVIDGQKTGHFLDQRDNRQLIRDRARGANVLDVFSSTGGFSVYAASGGARSVHSVDLSPEAIEAAQRNMAHNAELTRDVRHRVTVGDAFEVMAELGERGERFDIVVVDPPSFASRASERDAAIRAYRKLAELAVPLVSPGGLLLQASCSSRVDEADLVATVNAALDNQNRRVSDSMVTGHAIDHPVTFPQGSYLDAYVVLL